MSEEYLEEKKRQQYLSDLRISLRKERKKFNIFIAVSTILQLILGILCFIKSNELLNMKPTAMYHVQNYGKIPIIGIPITYFQVFIVLIFIAILIVGCCISAKMDIYDYRDGLRIFYIVLSLIFIVALILNYSFIYTALPYKFTDRLLEVLGSISELIPIFMAILIFGGGLVVVIYQKLFED